MTLNSMNIPINILVLDPKSDQNSSLRIAIPELLHRFKLVTGLKDALEELKSKDYLILIMMIDDDSKELIKSIRLLRNDYSNTEILVAIAPENQQLAAEAISQGAADCLVSPINSDILQSKIMAVAESRNNKSELMMLRQQIAMNYGFDNFVGVSLKIERIRKTAMQMALCDIPIVISGHPGTGKSLLANIIHYHSLRRKSDFHIIDCSSLTNEFIESELKKIFEASDTFKTADNSDMGSLFISHLDSMDLKLQKRLTYYLSLIKSNEDIKPRLPRIIVSCSEPLFNLTRKNLIDKQLINLLQAIEISIPPLDNRTEDIEVLAAYYLRKFAFENEIPTVALTSAAVEKLTKHDWPGNVREMENCLRRAVTICPGESLDARYITFVASARSASTAASGIVSRSAKQSSLADNQRLHITKALEDNNWNFTHTAQQLGIGRTTLWRKVRKFNLKRNEEYEAETLGVYSDEQQQ